MSCGRPERADPRTFAEEWVPALLPSDLAFLARVRAAGPEFFSGECKIGTFKLLIRRL